MTRCEEFYEKWKRDPNWCDKCDTEVRRINRYIETLDKYPALKDVSAGALRPVLEKKLDEVTRDNILTKIETEAKDGREMKISDVSSLMAEFPIGKKEVQIEVQGRGICSYANCGMGTNFGKIWEGQFVCPNCYDRLERGEITLTQYKPDKKPVEPLPVTTSVLKPKDTWEQRKAQMHPPVSKMEMAVLAKLEIRNIHPEVQREFCLRTTRPDYYFAEQNLAVYLDGEVHKGREDRDEAIRELLAKRYGVRVVSIAYEGSSEATEDNIVQQIMETLKA